MPLGGETAVKRWQYVGFQRANHHNISGSSLGMSSDMPDTLRYMPSEASSRRACNGKTAAFRTPCDDLGGGITQE
jgi:hypothetical protein